MNYSKRAVGVCFAYPALGGLLFGYDIGATSYVINQLTRANSGVSWYKIIKHSAFLQGLITSGGVAGALIGAIIAFRIAAETGRRKEIIYGAWLFLLGAGLELISGGTSSIKTSSALGLCLLITGRLVYGIACGLVMHGAPQYIAEMTPASLRGTLVSLKEAAIVLGISLGYAVGFAVSSITHGWQLAFGASIPLALLLLLGASVVLPPSARWLALRGDMKAAQRSLEFIYTTPAAVEEAMNELRQVLAQEETIVEASVWDHKYRPALTIGIGVVLLQQLTGQPSVLYYADSIFEDAGIGAIATVFVGIFKLIATLLAVFTIDKYGRRYLLLLGITVMFFALFGLTAAFAFESSGGGLSPIKLSIIIFIFIYISGYQAGFGPIAWTLISEIFPLEVRGQAVALAVQTNFAANLLVTFLFPVAQTSIQASLGSRFSLSFLFAIFTILDIYSFFFVKAYVPETKNLSLEQIQARLMKRTNRLSSLDPPLLSSPTTNAMLQTTEDQDASF